MEDKLILKIGRKFFDFCSANFRLHMKLASCEEGMVIESESCEEYRLIFSISALYVFTWRF